MAHLPDQRQHVSLKGAASSWAAGTQLHSRVHGILAQLAAGNDARLPGCHADGMHQVRQGQAEGFGVTGL